MDKKVMNQASGKLKARNKQNKKKRLLGILSAAVAVATITALVLPASTMSKDTYCGKEEHVHTEKCYTEQRVLTCGQTESEGHAHTDACYEMVLTCGLNEGEEHQHTDECYQSSLICGQAESEGHTHTDACYETVNELICGLEEHKHSSECYVDPAEQAEESSGESAEESAEEEEADPAADPTADVESKADWEATMWGVELSGNWEEDVLKIADTQLGYEESAANYITLEDGTQKGYTRYGAWYGDSYGDWCAMFVSFCMYYADIPADAIPQEANCQRWIELLKDQELDLYRDAADYIPKTGDVIFFDGDGDEISEHVGLVREIKIDENDPEHIRVKSVQGNAGDCVQYVWYELDDEDILGYGVMPKNPDYDYGEEAEEPEEETPAEPLRYYYYDDESVSVAVGLPESSAVPAGAELVVTPITTEDDDYRDLAQQANDAVEGEVLDIVLYDISFFVDGEYLPVDDNAEVSISFVETVLTQTEGAVEVVHLPEDDPAESLPEVTAVEAADGAGVEEVEFETPGFSKFAVVKVLSTVLTDGQYVLINGTTANSSRGVTVAESGTSYTLGTATVGTVTTDGKDTYVEPSGTTDFAEWQFVSAGNNKYYIKLVGTDYYLYYSSGLKLSTSSQTSFTVSLTTTSDQTTAKISFTSGSTTRYLRINGTSFETARQQTNATSFILAKKVTEQSGGGGTSGEAPKVEPTYNKTAIRNEANDGTYTLSLDVSSKLRTTVDPPQYDVLFVVDVSNSMKTTTSSGTRMSDANGAVTNLLSSLKTKCASNTLDVNFSIIRFANHAENVEPWTSLGSLSSNYTCDLAYSDLSQTIGGGTNYQAALLKAQEQLATSSKNRPDAIQVVIFLTDGVPTHFYADKTSSAPSSGYHLYISSDDTCYSSDVSAKGYWTFTSDTNDVKQARTFTDSGYEGKTQYSWKLPYRGALWAADNVSCDYFYAVGIDVGNDNNLNYLMSANSEVSDGLDLLQDIADNINYTTSGVAPSLANASLDSVFSQISQDMTYTACSNVTIEDTLSEYAELVVPEGGTATPVITVKKSDGTLVKTSDTGTLTLDGTDVNAAATLTASIVANKIKLEFSPVDYKLENDWVYSVSVQIQPSEAAKTEFETNGYTKVGSVGDPGTGTHENETGFYCNDTATLIYTTGGTPKTADYKKPVIQLDGEGGGGGGVVNDMKPTIHKEAWLNANGNYDLTLDVSSKVKTNTTPAQYDVLFVVDTSKSMSDKMSGASQTKISQARTAVTNMINELAANTKNGNMDARYSIVTFSGTGNTTGNADADAKEYQSWTAAVTSPTVSFSATGGTNYQAGLLKANEQLVKSKADRPDAIQVVVFITDGAPARYNGSVVNTEAASNWQNGDYYYNFSSVTGGQSAQESQNNNQYYEEKYRLAYNGALWAASKISCNYFYAVSFDAASDTDELENLCKANPNDLGDYNTQGAATVVNRLLNNLMDQVITGANGKQLYSIDSSSNISQMFADIVAEIGYVACNSVSIEDTLSDYVEVVDAENAVPVITVTKANGEKLTSVNGTVTLPATSLNKTTTTATAEVKEVNGETVLTLNFEDGYRLETDWTYAVTLEIQPSQTAIDQYGTNKTYPVTGDEGTGEHAGLEGFYSNDRAVLRYSIEGTAQPDVDYPMPVVQVEAFEDVKINNLVITKIGGGNTTNTLSGAAFRLTDLDPSSTAGGKVLITGTDGTSNGGEIIVNHLYKLEETQAPENYVVNDPIYFRVVEKQDKTGYAFLFFDYDEMTETATERGQPTYVTYHTITTGPNPENDTETVFFGAMTISDEMETITVSVRKIWANDDGSHGPVRMRLYRSPVEVSDTESGESTELDIGIEVGSGYLGDISADADSTATSHDNKVVYNAKQVGLTDANGNKVWTCSWTVPIGDAGSGTIYQYYIVEDYDDVNGYSVSYAADWSNMTRGQVPGTALYGAMVPTGSTYSRNDFTVTITNTAGQELPHTGGMGTWVFTIGGIVLLLLGATLALWRVRRKQGAN